MTARTVDILLDRCSDMQGQRDRAIAQRAGYESHLWFAESLLKQVARLLPTLLTQTPHDSAARDVLLEQINEFINEPRHHPELPDGAEEGEASAPSGDPA